MPFVGLSKIILTQGGICLSGYSKAWQIDYRRTVGLVGQRIAPTDSTQALPRDGDCDRGEEGTPQHPNAENTQGCVRSLERTAQIEIMKVRRFRFCFQTTNSVANLFGTARFCSFT